MDFHTPLHTSVILYRSCVQFSEDKLTYIYIYAMHVLDMGGGGGGKGGCKWGKRESRV